MKGACRERLEDKTKQVGSLTSVAAPNYLVCRAWARRSGSDLLGDTRETLASHNRQPTCLQQGAQPNGSPSPVYGGLPVASPGPLAHPSLWQPHVSRQLAAVATHHVPAAGCTSLCRAALPAAALPAAAQTTTHGSGKPPGGLGSSVLWCLHAGTQRTSTRGAGDWGGAGRGSHLSPSDSILMHRSQETRTLSTPGAPASQSAAANDTPSPAGSFSQVPPDELMGAKFLHSYGPKCAGAQLRGLVCILLCACHAEANSDASSVQGMPLL